jgi:trehalose synthase
VLEHVDIGSQTIGSYEASAGPELIERVRDLARPLRGMRLLHVSATPYGGGVAELLRSKIPLLRDLGIRADWKLIRGDAQFFGITKAMHNALQGATAGISAEDEERYLAHSARNAAELDEGYDVVVVHDPQPLALRELGREPSGRWIWRCHIDTSEPNPEVWRFLQPLLARYDAAVFTLGGFVPPDFSVPLIAIIPPAIDPESPKNLELGTSLSTRIAEWIGVDTRRPLVTQISRFDPWKDPLGVIAAYRLVRAEVPGLQLALVGSMASDDPEGWEVYRQIEAEVHDDDDIHVFTNLVGVGNVEVNAFQRLADVVIQKSLREGFGLVVSEALWKGTPVVAGRAGGIPLQMPDGVGGFLVDSVDECATRVRELLGDAGLRRELGQRGRAHVGERFLLPRLIADELELYTRVLDSGATPRPLHLDDVELRDPVCGMRLTVPPARELTVGDRAIGFCSPSCEQQFAADPERFMRALPVLPAVRGVRRRLARNHREHPA